MDRDGHGSPSIRLIESIDQVPAKQWTRIDLPFNSFKDVFQSTSDLAFDGHKLNSIQILQGLDDGQAHVLYIDDIRVGQKASETDAIPAPPRGLTAQGAEHHVNLRWNLGTNDYSHRIYRSTDSKHFIPVGTQKGDINRYADFAGKPPLKLQYRITSVDPHNRESRPSEIVDASTRPFSDDELLTMVQEGCFEYYWESAHPNAGMAIEVLPGNENLVAVGSSGFGIMALLTATERQFVTRQASVERMLKIVRFLKTADRFHGVWPHFLDGRTGKTIPYFGKYDNGGDLVETSFLIQGLLAARQYFKGITAEEKEIRQTITSLWEEVEWDWYRKDPKSDFLYWHWSPDSAWHISHPFVGWNESMIVYLLAIASPTHSVPASMYYSGWAGQSETAVRYRQGWSRTTQGDHYTNGNSYFGIKLDVGSGSGGELFFTQFSFMGFDPRGKRDRFANYFENNRNLALINHAYCAANPRGFVGYGDNCWGLSAGVNSGGGKPLPRDDNGTINISASLGVFPYTPKESMAALKHFYRDLGSKVWGLHGFVDGFNETQNWFEQINMGLNQAPIVVMIENYRSGLIWNLFMANPEIQPMLDKIGFVADTSPQK